MRKADIEFHSGYPAININVRGGFWPSLAQLWRAQGAEHEFSGDQAFWEWADNLWAHDLGGDESSPFHIAWQMATEDCYGIFKEDACEVLGIRQDQAWAEGRQGGWFVVDHKLNHDNWGKHVIESWDAVDVGRWAKVIKMARGYTEPGGKFDYQMVWNTHVNVYEAWAGAVI